MNRILSLILVISLFTGCSTIKGFFGKNANKESKQAVKIQSVEDKQNINLQDKMDQVGVLASGTDYALNKVTNKEPSVEVAQDINKRVLSLAGSPNIEAEKEMWKMVDTLLTDKLRGMVLMAKKDSEINALQQKDKQLRNEWQKEIDKYQLLAANTAMKADTLQQSMDKMDSWFGLGAVFYGLKRLVVRLAWVIGIGSVLFLILRFASLSNPIAGSIFSVFNMMGSWIVNAIKVIFPKALEMAGNTATAVFDSYKGTMVKIIDGIQVLKDQQGRDPNKKYTLDELMIELEKNMGDKDKILVTQIKQEIGYK